MQITDLYWLFAATASSIIVSGLEKKIKVDELNLALNERAVHANITMVMRPSWSRS